MPRVVGFVCEGSTDVVILRRIVETVFGEIDSRTLQPLVDELDQQQPGTASGWSAVRAWCQNVKSLDEYFKPDIGEPLDLLIIAIDLDIAVKAGIQKRPENIETYDTKALCDIVKSWLPSPLPERVVIAIPVMSTEAWVLAALFPRMPKVQAIIDPALILVKKKKLQNGMKGPWKRVQEYRQFANAIARKLKQVRKACSEAKRFVSKLERIAA